MSASRVVGGRGCSMDRTRMNEGCSNAKRRSSGSSRGTRWRGSARRGLGRRQKGEWQGCDGRWHVHRIKAKRVAAVLTRTPSMAAVMPGILLNPSPSAPYASLPLAFPDHPPSTQSLSSSSSSSSVSPSPASSTTNTPPPSTPPPRARSGSAPAGRRIRFAPLPDPRREFDDDGAPFDSDDDLVLVASPSDFSAPAPLLLAPQTPTPTAPAPAINVTASTPSSTASTFAPQDIQPPSPAATLKRTPSPGAPPHPPPSIGLAKKLFRPFLFRPAATSEDTLPGLGLFKTASRESSRSRDGDWGIPLGRWASETLSSDKGRRGSTSSSKSAPMSAWAPLARAQSAHSAPSSPKRRTTRLLNGRVYGAPRKKPKTPGFANVHEEPEFVEWGYGGMGSVKNGAGVWSKLQSDQRVVIGAYGDSERGRAATRTSTPAIGVEDDGGGMAWVKRRREERERKERERKEAEAKANAPPAPVEEAEPAAAPPASEPAPAAEDATEAEQEDAEKDKTQDHVHTAVAVPAPPHYHHHHSHSRTMSADGTPVSATPTLSRASTLEGAALVEEPAAIAGQGEGEDTGDDTEDDTEESGEKDDDDDDDEAEDDQEEQTRKTALGAGVEIVGRHAHHRE